MTQIFRSHVLPLLFAAAMATGLLAQPAQAQGGPSSQSQFLDAVRKGKGSDAARLLSEGSSTMVNTQDDSNGETALHITATKRDLTWTKYLLQNGADPNIANRKKVTPLMIATQSGFADGVEELLKYKAKVDAQNSFGETALILAVQLHDMTMVRLLLKAGANPDKADYSGQSARSHADRDPRARSVAELIKNGVAADAEKPNEGKLDFSGFEDKDGSKEKEKDKP